MFLKLFLFSALMYSSLSYSVTFSFYDGCHESPLVQGDVSVDIENVSVGDMTIRLLEKYGVPYVGSEAGLNSFFNSPIGLDALEAISDTKLRAYGPCYMVDGKVLNKMPNEVKFKAQMSKLTWFLGYASYDSGVWKGYCSPSHTLKSHFICGDKVQKVKSK